MNNFIKFSIVFIIFLFNKSFASSILPIAEGNIDARIKLIVYESMTCSHCADFHEKIYPELKRDYIDTGIAYIEFRNFPLDLAALNASKLAHCKNDGSSDILHFLFKNQKKWVRGSNIIDLNNNLKILFESENYSFNFDKCLNNKKIENHILQDRIDGSQKFKIESTPTLIINGKKFDKPLKLKNLNKFLKKMI